MQLGLATEGIERSTGNLQAIVCKPTGGTKLQLGFGQDLQATTGGECVRLEATEGVIPAAAVRGRCAVA